MRLLCGWCGRPTDEGECANCHRDPALPYLQRQARVPTIEPHEGRPALDETDIRRRYLAAVDDIERNGRPATVEAIAEALDRSPRTIREWRKKFGL